MILQPLVENALHHGLLAKISRGSLRILAHREGAHLRLSVEDDGLGLPSGGVVEGMGLGNTRARLEKLFGGAASLQIQAREGGGTRVDLRVPFQAATTQCAS
jgi:LytS/YehU family sensor histidine kinase